MPSARDSAPRLVAFAPGWEDTYPPPNPLGQPENYTHVVLAFITSYRWTTGARSRQEWEQQGPPCSDSCQLYLSASWNTFPSPEQPLADFRESGPGFVRLVKQRNPSCKVLLSIGGWQQSNLGQQNSDRTRGTEDDELKPPSAPPTMTSSPMITPPSCPTTANRLRRFSTSSHWRLGNCARSRCRSRRRSVTRSRWRLMGS